MVDSRMFSLVHLGRTTAFIAASAIAGVAGLHAWMEGTIGDLSTLLPEVAISLIFAGFMYLIMKVIRQIIQDTQGTVDRLVDGHQKALEKAAKEAADERAGQQAEFKEWMQAERRNYEAFTNQALAKIDEMMSDERVARASNWTSVADKLVTVEEEVHSHNETTRPAIEAIVRLARVLEDHPPG